MSSKNQVTLTFAGDSTSLDRATKQVGADLETVHDKSEHASKGFGEFNEKVEGSTKNFRGTADLVDGVTSSLQQFGINIPGQQVIGLARGMADMADGFSTVVGPAITKITEKLGFTTAATEAQTVATEESAVAQKGLNLAMLASPIGIMIAAATALAAGFYLLWQHSETFRNGVKALGRDAVAAFNGIVGVAETMGDGIKEAFRGAFNFVAAAWNNTVGRLSFHIPGWVPGIGGDGFSVPTIPTFANGGSFSGLAVVGERGPELIAGAGRVIPNAASRDLLGSGGQTVTLQVAGPSDDLFVEWFRKQVRVLGGGNVQVAMGRN